MEKDIQKNALDILNEHGIFTAAQVAAMVGKKTGTIKQARSREKSITPDMSLGHILLFTQSEIDRYKAKLAQPYKRVERVEPEHSDPAD